MELSRTSPKGANKRVNQLGGHYTTGAPLSHEMRMRIIDLSRQGFRQCDISRCMKVTHGCISKLLAKYQETGMVESSQNVGRLRVMTDEIERKVREYWATDPGLFCWQIRDRLLREKVRQAKDLPSLSSIGRLLKENMMSKAATEMTEKEEMVVEEKSPEISYTRFTIANILGLESEDDESKAATGMSQKDEMVVEEKSPEISYTRFTIANILGLESEDDEETSKKEESNQRTGADQKDDALLSERQTQRRERTRFTPIQLHGLHQEFRRNPYPGYRRRKKISRKFNINPVTIQNWFSNRRAREKKIQVHLMREPSICLCKH